MKELDIGCVVDAAKLCSDRIELFPDPVLVSLGQPATAGAAHRIYDLIEIIIDRLQSLFEFRSAQARSATNFEILYLPKDRGENAAYFLHLLSVDRHAVQFGRFHNRRCKVVVGHTSFIGQNDGRNCHGGGRIFEDQSIDAVSFNGRVYQHIDGAIDPIYCSFRQPVRRAIGNG